MRRSSRGLRINLDEELSLRVSELWLAVARAMARALRSWPVGMPALQKSSSRPVLSSNARQLAQALAASSTGGGGPASTTTTVVPRSRRAYPEGPAAGAKVEAPLS